ncbi:uncharacterized protein N7458_012754 [Penicillium daleae]|uniref:Uncharacterized protein n=1 Tax=Penicillium daleae TaxID=63821 RepID=A0AAD6BW54_9EURO|nr:uncharacterized protein N7458_012754 [Penicillium daleae]KAJ5433598.1 hypothetical protein N7458_012754 [Penicillium daleae]
MLLNVYREAGVEAAFQAFQTEMKGYENTPPLSKPAHQDGQNFWENEFMQFTIYYLDLRKIVDSKVSICVAAGVKSADAFYAPTTVPQSQILGCPRFIFPGHHSGYDAEPIPFATELLKALKLLDDQRNRD